MTRRYAGWRGILGTSHSRFRSDVNMRVAFAALLLGLAVAFATADLISDGYVADGKTTYCKMAGGESLTGLFRTIEARTADKCPLSLSMSVSVQSYSMETVTLDVTWAVLLSPNSSDVVLPAIAAADGQVPVIVSSVQACAADSYCATINDIIVPQLVGERRSVTLNTSSNSAVALSTYEFQLPASGDFVIMGIAGVSSSHGMVTNTVFQRVRTAMDGSTTPGTIKPPSPAFATPTTTAPSLVPSRVPVIPTRPVTLTPEPSTPSPRPIAEPLLPQLPILLTPQPSKLNPLNGQTTVTASSGISHGSALNALAVAGIAVVGIAIAAILAVIKRRREGGTEPPQRVESMRLPRSNHRRQLFASSEETPDSEPQGMTLDGTRSDRTAGAFVVLDTIRESFVLLQSSSKKASGQEQTSNSEKDDTRHREEEADHYVF